MRTLLRSALLALALLVAAPTAACATEVGDPETGTAAVPAEEPTAAETPGEATETAAPPVVVAEPEQPVPAEPEQPVPAEPVPGPAVEESSAEVVAADEPSPVAFARAALPAVPEALALLPIPAAQPEAPAALRTGVVAQISPDLDCSDFRFQEDAQIHYDANPTDPSGLDGPKGPGYSGAPGIACENLPSRGSSGLASVASAITPLPLAVPSLANVEAFVPAVVTPAVADLLASTGLPAPALAAVAAGLLGAGVILLLMARRRTG